MPRVPRKSATPGEAGQQESERQPYVHTLSLRLTSEQYRRLRRYVTTHEDRTNQRITHQWVLETALAQYLDRNRG